MSFYEREQKAIGQDEQDNRIVQELVNNYRQIKQKYEALQLQNSEQLKQIHQLKQINHSLHSQIAQLKQAKKYQQEAHHSKTGYLSKQGYFSKQLNRLTLQTVAPSIINKTIERTFNAQQTKRRVINGFVDQLTQELQQSQDMLRKERIMQEETRRTLTVCNQELSSLRVTVMNLQGQLAALSRQNQQLLRELQTAIHQKRKLEDRLSANLLEYNNLKGNFMINVEQFESEMFKMDSIYKNIEIQLQNIQ